MEGTNLAGQGAPDGWQALRESVAAGFFGDKWLLEDRWATLGPFGQGMYGEGDVLGDPASHDFVSELGDVQTVQLIDTKEFVFRVVFFDREVAADSEDSSWSVVLHYLDFLRDEFVTSSPY